MVSDKRGNIKLLWNLKVIPFMHIPTMYCDDEIDLSSFQNYTIGHSSEVEHIWLHDDE